MKKVSAIKIIFISLAALLVLCFITVILFLTEYGIRINFSGNLLRVYEHIQNGYQGTISLLLIIFIEVLFAVLIVGFLIALILFTKNNAFTQEGAAASKGAFSEKKHEAKKICSECGREINPEWDACPHCGKKFTI